MITALWTHRYRFILTITALSRVLTFTQPHRLSDNVYTFKLVRGCYLDYHASIQSLGLACPGVDYIRLWPWPVVQPWPDPTDWPEGPGWLAETRSLKW